MGEGSAAVVKLLVVYLRRKSLRFVHALLKGAQTVPCIQPTSHPLPLSKCHDAPTALGYKVFCDQNMTVFWKTKKRRIKAK